jgi:hypothetical protein
MNLTIKNHEMNHEGHWQMVDGRVLSFASDNGIAYPLSRLNEQQVAEINHFASEKPWTRGVLGSYCRLDEWVVIEHTVEGFVDYSDEFGWVIENVTIDGEDPSEWGADWYEAATEVLTDRFEQLTCQEKLEGVKP